ncbi:MAG: class I SAM-dependent methyltransferase [Deltaproteobacteria bacterium]|nr:class I SAM-dependent methyltransferase [Deltaproteobacteria bacterium]
MGLVLEADSARLFEAWRRSAQGKGVEKMVEVSVRTMLEPQPGERVLDIGCGDGNHLMLFSRLGLQTAGIDASPYMVGRARDRLGNRTPVKLGRAEELPFDDNEFDLAVLINTLEFLDEPLAALMEAGRVARRKVFIGVMNRLSWHCLCSRVNALFRDSLFDHVRFYDVWELQSYARTAFGKAPMNWGCARMRARMVERIGGPLNDIWNARHCPFGIFLGLSISLLYTVRTEQHPLKLGIGEAGRGAIKGATTSLGSESTSWKGPHSVRTPLSKIRSSEIAAGPPA